MSCSQCGQQVEPAFRFCPWCGSAQRLKLVEHFRGHDSLDRGRWLRVSRYLRTAEQEPHVRFSVWRETGEAQAALSIEDDEAARLAAFLRPPAPPRASRLREALEQLRR